MEKVAREKEKFQQRVSEELPSWLSWATKPLAGIAFDLRHKSDCEKGDTGESKAILGFWTLLPREWILINDVILEPVPEEFIQVDHMLIGPPGIFFIETKAWEGAFQGYKDNWKRKQGNTWVRCDSPTKQNERHVRLFKKWLEDQQLISKTNMKLLNQEQIDKIADVIINAKPYGINQAESKEETKSNLNTIKIQTGKTKYGRSFVKILGSAEEARRIWADYEKEGKNPSQLKADKFLKDAWFFYFTE